jgi:MFS family permease
MFALIASGTVLGIAGTDLVLPAVPSLPAALGGSIEEAQLVLAAYVLGTLVGLLTFGELGARFDPRRLLVWSIALFSLASLAAVLVSSLTELIALRLLQGAFGSAPAVFAPGFLKGLYPPERTAHMFGRLGSIESLVPALAPVVGVYLLALGGWTLSFTLVGGLGLLLAVVFAVSSRWLPAAERDPGTPRSYGSILTNRAFLRHGLSQAFALGGLLVFVFGAPAVLTGPLGMTLTAFVILQVTGITTFITGANLSSGLARRFGTDEVIMAGTALVAVALLLMLAYALAGGRSLGVIVALWIPVNFGYGARGPIGFHQAILAAAGDHSRGAALVIAGILGTTAAGTALVAPFVTVGLSPLAFGAATIAVAAVVVLVALRDRPAVRASSEA